jgi:hypothetical protein
MFEESGAGRGGRDSDNEGLAAVAGVVFEVSSLVCTGGCLLVRLNTPSKCKLSHKTVIICTIDQLWNIPKQVYCKGQRNKILS